MKTSSKTFFTVFTLISLSIYSQPRNGGNDPRQGNNQNQNTNSNTTTWSANTTNNANDSRRGNGYVNIHIGGGNGYPNNYYGNNYGYSNSNYYNNNYNNGYNYGGYYNVKRAARNSINQSAGYIGQALEFSNWNDLYSPWLAKAISHQQYAKQLYFWGDYAGALNHAERAGFLAWNALSYFNNSYGYNNGGFNGNAYPDPYGDPNNPYYRQNNSNAQPNMNTVPDDNYGYNQRSSSQGSGNANVASKTVPAQKMELNDIDKTLPQNTVSDRELLKVSAKDLSIE